MRLHDNRGRAEVAWGENFMQKISINNKIVDSLGLSIKEKAIFDALLECSLPNSASRLSKRTKVPRATVVDILRRLEKRSLVEQVSVSFRKVRWWKYKSGLEYIDKNKKANLPIIGSVK